MKKERKGKRNGVMNDKKGRNEQRKEKEIEKGTIAIKMKKERT